jgi:hypothetical protein
MRKWEYKKVSFSAEEEEMNKPDAEGWEMVAAGDYYYDVSWT